MPPNKQAPSGNFPPSTREAEYKIIIHKVNEICVTIRRFAKTYFDRKALNYPECSKCLNDILNLWGCDVTQFKTWKEYSEKLKIKDVNEKIHENEHYSDLLYIFDRAKRFEVMIPGIREQVVALAREHLYKYCVSFVEEIESLDVRPVLDYDEAIKGYKKDIEAKIDQINSNILTYGDLKTPFDKFVAEGNVHGTLMEDICVLIVEVSHLMKKWVSEDASYPEKLLQEVFFNNSYRETLEEDILKLQEKRREAERSLERKHKHHNRITRQHGHYKRQKRKLKNSLETVNNKIARLSFEIQDKNSEITSLQNTLGDKTPRSHREKGELNLKIEKTETFVERVEEWRSVMERQKLRLERELKTVSDRTYELKVEGVTERHEADEMRNGLLGIDIEIKSIRERITSIDEKTVVLKRIRVLKLSPDTLRKMHRRKSPPNASKVMAGNLEEACRYVAQYIGRDWKVLYSRLPFIPPRDPDRRNKDVAVIDQISARRDKTPEESALTSLEKWRSFNRHGNIGTATSETRDRKPFVIDKPETELQETRPDHEIMSSSRQHGPPNNRERRQVPGKSKPAPPRIPKPNHVSGRPSQVKTRAAPKQPNVTKHLCQ